MRRKLLLTAAVLLIGAGLGLYLWYRSGGLQQAMVEQFGRQLTLLPQESKLLQKALGFSGPQTYLILFLNNTEMRPAGGFIGAYGVVKVDKMIPDVLKVEGTESLDNSSSQNFVSVPPEPLQKYLPIKRWEFRDSNWSPDFASSSAKAIDLFKKENGTSADNVDAVVGITPTVLEEVLKIGGPISVNGEEFNAQNFTDKLEYEVEYGYAEKGLSFQDRKKVLADLTQALLVRIRGDIFKHWPEYLALSQKMAAEKQVLVYAKDPETEKELSAKGWGGEIKQTQGDYLLWVDANLDSLKTDKVIDRELSYSFAPTISGRYLATVQMKYTNNGSFSKFTSRYRTYARIFLPVDSQFISVSGGVSSSVEQGVENGKRWFGTFISIEPGKTGELIWQFYLDPQLVDQIKNNFYSLLVQKQSGTIASGLTLSLNFGKNIVSTNQNEVAAGLESQVYGQKTDLRVDREFKVNLKSK